MTRKIDESQKELFVSMFQELFSLLSKLHRVSEDLLTEAQSDITHSCWTILQIITREKESLSVPQIAELRSTSRQAVQRQICLLLEYGYIQAVDNPSNKRSPLYEATPLGLEYHATLSEKIYGSWLQDIIDHMGTAGAETLLGSIRELDGVLNVTSAKAEAEVLTQ